jgi:hypothetical protein
MKNLLKQNIRETFELLNERKFEKKKEVVKNVIRE